MATSSSLKVYVSDITKCPICLEDFDKPRVLNCQHTYCLKCLVDYCGNGLPGDDVQCPVCRREFQIPDEGVDALQHNFFMEDLVSAKSAPTKADNSTTCEGCEEDSPAAHCVDCSLDLCERCGRSHRKWRGGPHQVVGLSEKGRTEVVKLRGSYCAKHADEMLKMFCVDCKDVICTVCFAVKHQKHECLEISQVVGNLQEQIQSDIEMVSLTLDHIRREAKSVATGKQEFKTKTAAAKMEASRRGEEIKRVVDKEVGELVKQIESTEYIAEKEFVTCQEGLELSVVAMESFTSYCQELLKKGSLCDVVRAANYLHVRAVELQQMQNTSGSYQAPDVNFEPTNLQDALQSRTQLIGKVIVTANSPDVPPSLIQQVEGMTVREQFADLNHPTSYCPRLLTSLELRMDVVGVAALGEELYVCYNDSDVIEQLDSNFKRLKDIHVNNLKHPVDIVVCGDSRAIYVAESSWNNTCVWRVTDKRDVKQFVSGFKPHSLSVTSCRLLVTSHDDNKLRLFGAGGKHLKQVSMPVYVQRLHHAVESRSGRFIICYRKDSLYYVSEVDTDGHVIRTCSEQVNFPRHLALDIDGRVFLADCNNDRVLLLSNRLQLERVLLDKGELHKPCRLCYVPESDRLVIAEENHVRVKVYSLS